jgi:acyl-CoA oxidase
MSENTDMSLKPALERIFYLASLHFLDKHLVIFYQGGYFINEQPVALIRESIIELCSEMKNDAIALIDAIAPPDFVLNSSLGSSTGDAYKTVYSMMIQSKGAFERIEFLEEYLEKKKFGCLRSNL